MSDAASPRHEPVDGSQGRLWSIGVGAVLLALGIAGVIMTVAFTVVNALWYGVLLIVAGMVQILEAVASPAEAWNSRLVRILAGALYGAGGLYVVVHPGEAPLVLALLLGLVLIVSGVVRAVGALFHAAWHSRGMIILLAVLSVALGVAILSQWPLSGLWAIGLFVSCDLIAAGLSWGWAGFAPARDGEAERRSFVHSP